MPNRCWRIRWEPPDRDAMYGMLRQLVRASVNGEAQIEALSRYRNAGGPAITVQNVSVADGGNAIVGNVTQHASVIVSVDAKPGAQT